MPIFCATTRHVLVGLVFLCLGMVCLPVAAQQSVHVVVADAACEMLSLSRAGGDRAGGDRESGGRERGDIVYRAGVDVHGNPVTAADLPDSPLRVPVPISFDVSIDIAQRLGLNVDSEALLSVAQIGEAGGQITINGQPVGALARTMALRACQGYFGGR